jgi:hypothetical protein
VLFSLWKTREARLGAAAMATGGPARAASP